MALPIPPSDSLPPLPGGGPGAGPPGGPGDLPGGEGAPPIVPKSPIGGPGGPGGSPMMSPGAGVGNRAAATQQIKAVMPALFMSAMAFESGSREQQAVIRAISSLNPIFGKADVQNMVPAALASMATAARGGGPMSAAPPPGIQPDASKLPPGIQPPV